MKISVVWGPPASGKSTYVIDNRSENSLTFDFDRVMQALSGLNPHHKNEALIGLVLDVRQAVFDKIHAGAEVDDAWVIVSKLTDEFKANFESLEVEYILMDTDKETCLKRVDEDPDRSAVADEMKPVIEEWFEWYQETFENKIEPEPNQQVEGVIKMAKKRNAQAKKFWEFKAQADEPKVGELLLYGEISSYSWWGDEVTPKEFKEDLDALGDIDTLNVYINSGGGDVFAGQAVHSMLKRHKATVNVFIDGLAASIASVIAMAGDKITMPNNAMMMIHHPWTFTYGNATEFRKLADDLDKIGESIMAAYESKSGMTADELTPLLDAETWLTAKEAVEMGLADEVEETKQVAAFMRNSVAVINGHEFNLNKYDNPPKLAFLPPEPGEPDGGQEKLNMLSLELELLTGGSF